jgi:hypothetical protein
MAASHAGLRGHVARHVTSSASWRAARSSCPLRSKA